jgi:hypothetical protein
MVSLLSLLAGLFAALWVASVLGAARLLQNRENGWIDREEKWRERERVLVDRLLGQARVTPVEVQRENVVKLPDPEIQPASWVDEAFAVDSVKEELEQLYPEAARMSHAEAQAKYSADWRRIAKKLKEESTPLRA